MNTTIEAELVPQERAIAVREPQNLNPLANPVSVQEIIGQVALIQNVMSAVMKEGEHYGKIPGCGDKPALLKPGAEKLGFTFRLAPEFRQDVMDMGNGHREYRITCSLYTIQGHCFVGQGVGSCSTMEGKYRYRTGPKKSTGKPVPKSYWDIRKDNPAKAQELIGGKGYSTAKNDVGQWEIVEMGEKVEHDNPADYYNTILKMAKKRAHVDAILTATAASDIFVQDVEEMVADGLITPNGKPSQAQQSATAAPPQSGVSIDQQKKEALLQVIENACHAVQLRLDDMSAYLRTQKVSGEILLPHGGTVAQLPLPRLQWLADPTTFSLMASNVVCWLEQTGDNDIPEAAAPRRSQEEAQASAENAMGEALKKRTADQQEAVGVVAVVTSKPTKKPGSFKHGVKVDDAWYNTFDRAIADAATALKGQTARVLFKTSQWGNDLIAIEAT